MAGPNPIRRGVDRKSVTIFNPADAFTAGETITEVEITAGPSHGMATVVNGGTRVRYKAPEAFVRNATFSWRMKIDGVWTAPAVVNIRVGWLPRRPGQKFPRRPIEYVPINKPPIIATVDSATTAYRTSATINVLTNDTGVELEVIGVTQPSYGEADVTEDGTGVIYTPEPDFSGADSFMYIIDDGAQKAVGTVNVTVSPPALAAVADSATALGAAPITIYPLANDVGDTLVITAVGTPSSGTATVADGGSSVVYRANYGFFGDDSFTYTVRDASARTSTSTISVTVQRPDISIVGNPASTTTTTPVEIAVLANDVGVGLKVTGITFAPSSGTATVTGGGQTVTYTANSGFTGTDSFTYRAEDDYDQNGTAEVTVTVLGSGSTILAVNDTVSATGGVTSTISPLLNDTGTGLEISSVDAPSAGGTAVRTNGNTQILYTPLASFSGTETIRYTITDGISPPSSAIITATVGGTTFTVANDTAITTAATPVIVSPLANDSGSGLVLTRINGPVTASVTVRNDDTGTTPTPPPTSGKFSNGYSYRYRLRLPKWTRTGSMTNFLLPFSATLTTLKTEANGGFIEKAGAWDLRFETTTGTKLGHRIARYVATTGEIAGFLNMPRNFAKNETVYCYFGNSLITATEEDASLVRAGGWVALYSGNAGTDLAGTASRNLTPTSSPPAGTIGDWPAADLDGTADCLISTTNSALGLNGNSSVSVVSFHQADSTATKHEIFNIATSGNAELSFHFNEATNNRITATAKFGSTVYQMQSSDNKQVTTAQSVGVVWQSGQAGVMAINGALDTPGSGSGTVSGTLNIAGPLEWGRGGRSSASTTYWDGKVAALMFFNGVLPTAALESITKAFTDPDSVFKFIGFEGARNLLNNPFNKISSHHRPIGAGRQFYRAGGVTIVNYNAGNKNTYEPSGALNDMSDLQRIGALILGNDGSGQGRKFCFEVGSDATVETWTDRDDPASVRVLTPKLQVTKGGPLPYIADYTGADFENGWAPVNTTGSAYTMQRFNKTDYERKEYTSENSFDMRLTDNFESAGGLTGGAGMKWPGCVLRGHEVNDPNPGPIRHALHCTGTRKPEDTIAAGFTQADFDDYACLLAKEVLWPASRVDGSVNPRNPGYNAATAAKQNTGPFPYGSLFCVDHNDYDTVAALIGASNKRGLRLLECYVYYGMYLFDGQNDIVVRSGKPRGVMKVRIDGLVGLDKFGNTIAGVETDLTNALAQIRPYLKIIGNRLKYNALRAEDAPNGLPYIGGAKTLGDGSKQWVLDAANPDRSLNDAYDAPDGGYYEGG